MAIKTFTTGEVLTASDTNTYLANAGLVYITSTAVWLVKTVVPRRILRFTALAKFPAVLAIEETLKMRILLDVS